MRTFVEAFKNINNRSGGVYGIKKLSTSIKSAGIMGTLEDHRDVVVFAYTHSTAKIIRISEQNLKLKKSNNNRLSSDAQIRNKLYRKKKINFYFKKNRIFTDIYPVTSGRQTFASYKY